MTERPRRATNALLAATLLLSTMLLPSPARAESLNWAAAFRWKGSVTTAYSMSTFVGGDHTVTLKFMAQYTSGYAGPMFTSSDGNYAIGLGNYSTGTNRTKLQLTVGGARAVFSGPDVQRDVVPGRWNSLVVVRQIGRYRVYLNARLLSRDDCSSGCTSFGNGASAVSGEVVLGRQGTNAQFYGFLDDVGIFGRALNEAEVFLVSGVTRMSGSENGLLRAWTFDPATPIGAPNPPTVHSGTFVAPAYRTLVSQARNASLDTRMLPPPTVTVALPFTRAHLWRVQWSFAENSHLGNAIFAWDFTRFSGETETCGSALLAAAGGNITHWQDDGADIPGDDVPDPSLDASNDILLNIGTTGEHLRYLHVKTGSVRAALGASAPQNVAVASGDTISAVGTRGPNNCHLHFGYREATVTIPLGFRYEVLSDIATGHWTLVPNGMPRKGDVIRRAP